MGHNNKDTHLQQVTQEVEVVHFHVPSKGFYPVRDELLSPLGAALVQAVEVLPQQHLVEQAAHRPKVYGEIVAFSPGGELLRRHESGGTAVREAQRHASGELCAETEVRQLQEPVAVDEHVLRLKVLNKLAIDSSV